MRAARVSTQTVFGALKVRERNMANWRRSTALLARFESSSLPLTVEANSIHGSAKLLQLLSALPGDGVGYRIRQVRWAQQGLDLGGERRLSLPRPEPASSASTAGPRRAVIGRQRGPPPRPLPSPTQRTIAPKEYSHGCYWLVTKVLLRPGGSGNAFGKLYWNSESSGRKADRDNLADLK